MQCSMERVITESMHDVNNVSVGNRPVIRLTESYDSEVEKCLLPVCEMWNYLVEQHWDCEESKLAKSAHPESSSSDDGAAAELLVTSLPKCAQLSSLPAVTVVDETPTANTSALLAGAAADCHGVGSDATGATSIGASSNQSTSTSTLITTKLTANRTVQHNHRKERHFTCNYWSFRNNFYKK